MLCKAYYNGDQVPCHDSIADDGNLAPASGNIGLANILGSRGATLVSGHVCLLLVGASRL